MNLRYGINPHQRPATATPLASAPVRLVHGEPSYLNFLDALTAWQLVREASTALGLPAAASFKHVSPAGAAVAGTIDPVMADSYRVDATTTGPSTSAYLRARDADPKSSYGDFAAVSEPVDLELATALRPLACDGIIAPGFEAGAVDMLSAKKQGTFLVLEADDSYQPPAEEHRDIYGVRLTQPRDNLALTREHLGHGLPEIVTRDLLLGMIVLRYTQSNSVAYLNNGMAIGIGAGQQSRVDCTRLAGAKADTWWLRRHAKVRSLPHGAGGRIQDRLNAQIQFAEGDATLTSADLDVEPLTADERRDWLRLLDDVSFVSDGAIPFRDNIDHAHRHGVRYIAEPGGSIRSDDVRAACQEYGITLIQTGIRLFRH
jgi:phosphoribosylaminoimidazolecarboxamide formyltransferase/IMP cyclohydrolase